MATITDIEKKKRSELGRRLVKSRWKNATAEDRAKQVQQMVKGKKKFWKNLSPDERSKRMKLVRAKKKHAKG